MKYFTDKELACPCCGQNKMDNKFSNKLDRARGYANIPFVITSGYRCPAHNEEVGGSKTSSHLKGIAVDIAINNPIQRCKIFLALLSVGFSRFGIGKNFIHVDIDPDKPGCCIWVY